MYRSRPRAACPSRRSASSARPLLIAATVATLFGVVEQYSVVPALAALPIFAWELSLGLWLTFKGFKPAAVAALAADSTDVNRSASAAAPAAIATPSGAA